MKGDWLFQSGDYICGLRAAAVIVSNNMILLQKERGGSEYALPGGHIKAGETLKDGLIREISEELDVKILCKRLLWSEECFWSCNCKKAHSIAFYYLAELCEGYVITQEAFIPQRDNPNVLVGWMPIGEISGITIYPEFLKKEILHLDEPIRHFTTID